MRSVDHFPSWDTSPRQEAELRLVLYAIDMLAPYQSQVVKVSLIGTQVDAMAYLLERITNRWKMVRRLLKIGFIGRASGDGELHGWTTISQSLVHPSFMRLGMPQSEKPTWLSLPAKMSHLESLTQLEIPSTSWLRRGGLILPHAMRHLNISYCEAETIPTLYQYLSNNNSSRNHLRSIAVHGRAADGRAGRPWKFERLLIVPRLLSLFIDGVVEGQLNTFLGFLFCPSLETLDLALLKRSLNMDEPPVNLDPATTNPPLLLESSSRIPLTHGNNGIKSQTAPIGSHSTPVHLRLEDAPSTEETLGSFNHGSMSTLHMGEMNVQMKSSFGEQQAIGRSIPATTVDQRVSMPSLTQLKYLASQQQLMHFLAHLLAPSLLRMTVGIHQEESPANDFFQEYPLVPFPSLGVMKCTIYVPLDIRSTVINSEVFPNLQELHIHYTDPTAVNNYVPGWGDLPKESVISLWRAMGSTVQGTVPFPKLSSLEVKCS
jgi:hypothetical protein